MHVAASKDSQSGLKAGLELATDNGPTLIFYHL